eukprot:182519-Prymnesium_polylepis.1
MCAFVRRNCPARRDHRETVAKSPCATSARIVHAAWYRCHPRLPEREGQVLPPGYACARSSIASGVGASFGRRWLPALARARPAAFSGQNRLWPARCAGEASARDSAPHKGRFGSAGCPSVRARRRSRTRLRAAPRRLVPHVRAAHGGGAGRGRGTDGGKLSWKCPKFHRIVRVPGYPTFLIGPPS